MFLADQQGMKQTSVYFSGNICGFEDPDFKAEAYTIDVEDEGLNASPEFNEDGDARAVDPYLTEVLNTLDDGLYTPANWLQSN